MRGRSPLCETQVESAMYGDHELKEVGGHRGVAAFQNKVMREVKSRGKWLLILMMFQSGSSFVLNHYATLVREHLVLTLFLTMLVGAGGNAGAQSAMQTLQQITAEGDAVSLRHTLKQQGPVALWLGVILACMAWLRVYFFHGVRVRVCARARL